MKQYYEPYIKAYQKMSPTEKNNYSEVMSMIDSLTSRNNVPVNLSDLMSLHRTANAKMQDLVTKLRGNSPNTEMDYNNRKFIEGLKDHISNIPEFLDHRDTGLYDGSTVSDVTDTFNKGNQSFANAMKATQYPNASGVMKQNRDVLNNYRLEHSLDPTKLTDIDSKQIEKFNKSPDGVYRLSDALGIPEDEAGKMMGKYISDQSINPDGSVNESKFKSLMNSLHPSNIPSAIPPETQQYLEDLYRKPQALKDVKNFSRKAHLIGIPAGLAAGFLLGHGGAEGLLGGFAGKYLADLADHIAVNRDNVSKLSSFLNPIKNATVPNFVNRSLIPISSAVINNDGDY